ncbi:hypothetical protein GY45DRAFT_1229415, partial [Cubamyces sp. BRFM 1775]
LRKSGIAGFNVPGLAERLVASLFADDTTVFLSETDSYGELMNLLRTWCTASRAKFNNDKTTVIPVGTEAYRRQVVCLRKLSPRAESERLPADIKILPDGQAARVLGAWLGNNVDPSGAWTPVLDTVRRCLMRWNARRPTLNARRLIVNLEVGGQTQFLARAQSMPPMVEKALQKIITGFVWRYNSHHCVDIKTLHQPVSEGGLVLLDVKARNEALDLVWMRDYLDLSERRHKWAYLADAVFAGAARTAHRTMAPEVKLNQFIQTWKVNAKLNGPLPPDMARAIRTARKYGLCAAAQKVDVLLQNELPIWAH